MKSMILAFLAMAAGYLSMPDFATAHHGWAAFDSKTKVTFQGTVTDFRFLNPHSVVEFDAKDDQGQIQNWQGELTSASRLAAKGWTATTIETGNELTISGYPAQSGVRVLRIMKILGSNGAEIKIDPGN